MELEDYLNHVNAKKRIVGGSDEHLFMHEMLSEALKITHRINSEYHTPEEIQDLPMGKIDRRIAQNLTAETM